MFLRSTGFNFFLQACRQRNTNICHRKRRLISFKVAQDSFVTFTVPLPGFKWVGQLLLRWQQWSYLSSVCVPWTVRSSVFTGVFVAVSMLLRGLEMFFIWPSYKSSAVIRVIPRRVSRVFYIFTFMHKSVVADFKGREGKIKPNSPILAWYCCNQIHVQKDISVPVKVLWVIGFIALRLVYNKTLSWRTVSFNDLISVSVALVLTHAVWQSLLKITFLTFPFPIFRCGLIRPTLSDPPSSQHGSHCYEDHRWLL